MERAERERAEQEVRERCVREEEEEGGGQGEIEMLFSSSPFLSTSRSCFVLGARAFTPRSALIGFSALDCIDCGLGKHEDKSIKSVD